MSRPLFLPKKKQPVARWRAGDELSYQRAPHAHWHPAKILDVILKNDQVLYRVLVLGKILLAQERQLGYPVRKRGA